VQKTLIKCSNWEAGCPGVSTNSRLNETDAMCSNDNVDRGVIKSEQPDLCAFLTVCTYIHIHIHRV